MNRARAGRGAQFCGQTLLGLARLARVRLFLAGLAGALARPAAKPRVAMAFSAQFRGRACGFPRHGAAAAGRGLGFTLIELVVVILLVGILVLLAVEKFSQALSGGDRLAADELKVNLRYLRALAMRQECATRVRFNLASNLYTVEVAGTNGVFQAATNPVTRLPWVVDVAARFSGAQLAAVSNLPGNTLYFNGSNGVPCYHTNTPLTTNAAVVFNSGLAVSVVAGTGYVEAP